MAVVFDKIYFPGVYIPEGGIDVAETKKEIARLQSLGRLEIEGFEMINCMISALNHKYLKDFCVFTGKVGVVSDLQDGTKELIHILYQLVHGSPPPNFIPTISLGCSKALPGEKDACVNFPGWLSYPANALIYSIKNGVPLVSDNPRFPVPTLGGLSPKDNAKLLSTILAIEAVNLLLPPVKELTCEQILEFREETREFVKPFRVAMIRLSKELNAAINSEISLSEVKRAARFIVETTVQPELAEFKAVINDPSKPWYGRVVDLAKSAPGLLANFSSMPANLALANVLAKIVGTLADLRDEQLEKEKKMKRSGFYYLIKIEELASQIG